MTIGRFHSRGEFAEALRRCHEVAEEEYHVAEDALGQAETAAGNLRDQVENVALEVPFSRKNEHGMPEVIRKLGEQLTHQVEHQIIGMRRKLAGKRPRLQKFTIALFGRTMAGKSTFREAITGGDGASIGKGGQNTTKQVHEYEWRGLHIIDTPGIGSFQGEHYRQQAISAVGKSDLVLFLLSDDGIHQEVFDGMKEVLLESKPVIFILNVKRDLTKVIHRERFLRDPKSLLGRDRIDGHFRRIQKLAVDTLGSKSPRVFVIHAQAAHFAAQAHSQAEALHLASGMEELHEAICQEVTANGPIRRLQTVLDGTISSIDGLHAFYSAESARLKDEASFFQRRKQDFDLRASQFLKDQTELITARVADCFRVLENQVFDFIEDNIEERNIADRWQHRVNAERIEEKLKSLQEQIAKAATAFVAEFARETAVDSSFINASGSTGIPQHADVWDLRRGFGRTAAAAGALSAVAFLAAEIGAANIWNPVGWVLIGVSVVAGIFAWFFGKKADRLAKEKEKARTQLRLQIRGQASALRGGLLKWLHGEVERKAIKEISEDLALAVEALKSLSKSLHIAERCTDAQVDRLNIRLLVRIAEVHRIPTENLKLIRSARARGLVFRALSSPCEQAGALSRLASTILREDVLLVPDAEPKEIIRRSLHPLKPVRIERKGRKFCIQLSRPKRDQLGQRTTAALLETTRRITKVSVTAT